MVTKEQFTILDNVKRVSLQALTPLQKLEHGMHPLVAFIIMPIFALSNAGVTLESDALDQLTSPVAIGIFFGLVVGKLVGVVLVSYILIRLKWATLPVGMNSIHLLGAGVLTAIGFTMSLFITGLAFTEDKYILQAKLGVLAASLLCSVAGYFLIRYANAQKTTQPSDIEDL